MKRREFLKSGFLLGAGLMAGRGFAGPLVRSRSHLPNIIIIFTDDQGWGDLGCYGSDLLNTPNIDELAKGGIRFTSFYSSAPVCSPSRAGLITGRYPPRTKVTDVLRPNRLSLNPLHNTINAGLNLELILEPGTAFALPKKEITLAQALKSAGYATCCIGKWHLGDIPGYRPHERGFDHYLGLLYSNDMVPLPLWRNSEIVEKHPVNQDYLTQKYTKEALWFIKENKNRPFFLYLAHTFPHVPLHCSPRFRGKSKAGLYGDCIEEIDWSTGEILNALDRYGILKNTLILYSSDNGPWWQGNPGYHRGRKHETFDGGMRVPFIAYWQERIPPGQITDQMAMNIDFFPTCLSAAGLTLPKDRIIDGKNLLPLLEGKEKTSPHQALYFYNGRQLQAIRVGRWKYHRKHYLLYYPIGMPKGPYLFDLKNDPNESYNVIDLYPEVARELENMMKEWEKRFKPGV